MDILDDLRLELDGGSSSRSFCDQDLQPWLRRLGGTVATATSLRRLAKELVIPRRSDHDANDARAWCKKKLSTAGQWNCEAAAWDLLGGWPPAFATTSGGGIRKRFGVAAVRSESWNDFCDTRTVSSSWQSVSNYKKY